MIAFNGGRGIALLNDGTVAHIRRNRIFKNEGLAIDLGDDGRTPNDPGDADTGSNRLLNFPVLKRAVTRAAARRSPVSTEVSPLRLRTASSSSRILRAAGRPGVSSASS